MTAPWRRPTNGRHYSCSLCEYVGRTRYGFRMHMLDVHDYVSKAHAKPGTGFGRFPRVKSFSRWLRAGRPGTLLHACMPDEKWASS